MMYLVWHWQIDLTLMNALNGQLNCKLINCVNWIIVLLNDKTSLSLFTSVFIMNTNLSNAYHHVCEVIP